MRRPQKSIPRLYILHYHPTGGLYGDTRWPYDGTSTLVNADMIGGATLDRSHQHRQP